MQSKWFVAANKIAFIEGVDIVGNSNSFFIRAAKEEDDAVIYKEDMNLDEFKTFIYQFLNYTYKEYNPKYKLPLGFRVSRCNNCYYNTNVYKSSNEYTDFVIETEKILVIICEKCGHISLWRNK